ncbi:PREDICTED: uncharacterized protein LOC100633882 [Amphimedon queenslandica]|uniref:Na+/H+ antiporter NhaC-like C-terminal domain-containing protein n=1 Tax=Amphimedon queenslandica TaxID=400682 RepID=A0AAN0IV74_AMPQE|nr:PREDICTED: uncharacterized protein LOC100633882 [Amphimedon queenslandica]|eukprot:XP_019848639.1 PREDICTED: uncharacterized protein LOC100633882 [Amphimedon queenslandica]
MSLFVSLLLALFLVSPITGQSGDMEQNCSSAFKVTYPSILLANIQFQFIVDLPPYLDVGVPLPENINITMLNSDGILLFSGSIATVKDNGMADLSHTFTDAPFDDANETLHMGHHTLTVKMIDQDGTELCSNTQTLLSIPGWLTILPPILTAVIAIAFRQVLLALLIGIWLSACLARQYNVFAALLRTLDYYIVSSMGDFDHAEIIIGTFFLGGLIGLVQRSGGGLGLANIFRRFAKTNRRASIICFCVCLLIFFDDYTSILVVGTSMRTVMASSGVSKDKFAFIIQSMAPTMASFIPISSWIGAQLGYVSSGFDNCVSVTPNKYSPFEIVSRSLPYRFLPILMLFCVILVCILNRDFACMLTSERESYKELHRSTQAIPPPVPVSRPSVSPPLTEREARGDRQELHCSSDISNNDDLEDTSEGPLSPKRGVPHRWFNAIIPFVIVIVLTFSGMILDGWWFIRENNKDDSNERISVSITNIFGNADAMAAVIWSVCLATLILSVMLMVQKILSFSEVMTSWIEGVKDVIEPLFILVLAWALGSVITETQTSNFIAQVLRSGNISADYVPVITTIIGYFMAYCTGSAFGTMGILFPLVIPTVCHLTDDPDIQVQAAAAILSSCIFGNLMSPIADLTVLTRVSTQCDLNSHIKTCSPYTDSVVAA